MGILSFGFIDPVLNVSLGKVILSCLSWFKDAKLGRYVIRNVINRACQDFFWQSVKVDFGGYFDVVFQPFRMRAWSCFQPQKSLSLSDRVQTFDNEIKRWTCKCMRRSLYVHSNEYICARSPTCADIARNFSEKCARVIDSQLCDTRVMYVLESVCVFIQMCILCTLLNTCKDCATDFSCCL